VISRRRAVPCLRVTGYAYSTIVRSSAKRGYWIRCKRSVAQVAIQVWIIRVRRTSVKPLFMATVFALLLWHRAVPAAEPVVPLGRYSAVTESEWSLDLDLNRNGRATLTVASWDPGERSRAKVKTYFGRWRVQRNNIVVQFKAGEGVFTYHDRLSFEEFGRNGGAPGLVGASATLEPNLLVGRHL
jgi:hypothetical protein